MPFSFHMMYQVGHLHCLLPWWEDATVACMDTGGITSAPYRTGKIKIVLPFSLRVVYEKTGVQCLERSVQHKKDLVSLTKCRLVTTQSRLVQYCSPCPPCEAYAPIQLNPHDQRTALFFLGFPRKWPCIRKVLSPHLYGIRILLPYLMWEKDLTIHHP